MNIDKQTEYASLRQEILDAITSRDNYIIAMYTITTAVLCVAFELKNPILFFDSIYCFVCLSKFYCIKKRKYDCSCSIRGGLSGRGKWMGKRQY